MEEELFSIGEAAKFKNVAYNTMYDAIIRGQINPRPNVRGAVVIPRSELEQYVPLRRSAKKKVNDRIAELDTFVK